MHAEAEPWLTSRRWPLDRARHHPPYSQSVHENRIYSVKMHCGDKYPDEPPTIQFVSQVNLPCVNSRNGMVDPKHLPCLAQWKRENTMETVLIELRR